MEKPDVLFFILLFFSLVFLVQCAIYLTESMWMKIYSKLFAPYFVEVLKMILLPHSFPSPLTSAREEITMAVNGEVSVNDEEEIIKPTWNRLNDFYAAF